MTQPNTTKRPAGVRIVSTGVFLPDQVVTNQDLEKLMDTSDEWITQRTGISTRRKADDDETTHTMAAKALSEALTRANLKAADLDLLIVASATAEMGCPSTACRVLDDIAKDFGDTDAGAFDITAACSGFVYGINIAHEMIKGGAYKTVAVIGAEHLSTTVEYSDRGRGTAIIFGDAAGAAILTASDDTNKGIIAQRMHSNGDRWVDLYIPRKEVRDFPDGKREDELPLTLMRMNGRGVFKFAVGTFQTLIQQTLDDAGLTADDVDHFICHQSNVRILDAARDRFGIPQNKMPINIDRVGNTSAASVPLLLHEQFEAGKIKPGERVMLVAFGGGLTWTSSLWQF